jgi:hypothetical protein
MTVINFPTSPSHLTSPHRAIAEHALTYYLNVHLLSLSHTLNTQGTAAIGCDRNDFKIMFHLFSPEIYVRAQCGNAIHLTGRLGPADARTGHRALKVTHWSKKGRELLLAGDWRPIELAVPAATKPFKPKPRSSQKVVRFVDQPALATGRSRIAAAPAIVRQLKILMLSSGFGEGGGEDLLLYRAPLSVNFMSTADGVYFGIRHADFGWAMTGYLDAVLSPGRYAGGRLHPMTWNRGWEGSLFGSGEWLVAGRCSRVL